MLVNESEVWIEHPEYYVEVSSHGYYRSILQKPKIIKSGGTTNCHIYPRATVICRRTGKKCTRYVHRLIASAFYPVYNQDKLQVDHIDGVRTNNTVTNLQFVTASDNNTRSLKRKHNK